MHVLALAALAGHLQHHPDLPTWSAISSGGLRARSAEVVVQLASTTAPGGGLLAWARTLAEVVVTAQASSITSGAAYIRVLGTTGRHRIRAWNEVPDAAWHLGLPDLREREIPLHALLDLADTEATMPRAVAA